MIKDLVQLPSNGLTMVDLFCGAGVGAIGFKAAGYDLIYGFDNNRSAVRTYNKMIGNHAVAKNVRKLASVDVPYGDIYQGGFPCTSFSAGGAERGVLDEKNGDLGYHFARLVVDNQPKAFIAENVSGLAFPKHRSFLNTLLNTFSVGGYNVIWRLIDCYHYGVPQNRKRVFIVGIRKDLGLIFRFPAPISIFERTNLRDAIGDLPQPWEDHNFKNHKRFYNDGWAPRYCTTHRQRQWNEPSYTIVSVARQLPQYPEPPNYDIRKRHLYDCEPPRRFTVRECLRIQTVPDWFHFDDDDVRFDKQHERCSGIPPIVSYTLGVSLANQLKEERIKEKPLSLERKLAILQ